MNKVLLLKVSFYHIILGNCMDWFLISSLVHTLDTHQTLPQFHVRLQEGLLGLPG